MEIDSKNLRGYFLGSLSEAEARAVELRVIEDVDFSNELAAAETELIEDFLESRLTGEELKQFNSNYLISPAREVGVRDISLFKREAARLRIKTSEMDAGVVRRPTANWAWRTLMGFAVVAAVVIAAVVLWRAPAADRLSPLETEYAALNRNGHAGADAFEAETTFNLVPGTFRDPSGGQKKRTNPVAKDLRFRLALPSTEADSRSYNVRITRGTTVVFTQTGIPSIRNTAGWEVRFVAPQSLVTAGRYQLTLDEAKTSNRVAAYDFALE